MLVGETTQDGTARIRAAKRDRLRPAGARDHRQRDVVATCESDRAAEEAGRVRSVAAADANGARRRGNLDRAIGKADRDFAQAVEAMRTRQRRAAVLGRIAERVQRNGRT